MLNYKVLGDLNDVVSEIVRAHPANEMAKYKKELYNDVNFDNMLEASEGSIDEKTGKGKLTQKLWEDCSKDYSRSFGDIPKSQGDVTRYSQYPTIKLTIDFVNKIDSEYQLSSSLKPVTNNGLTQTNIQRMNRIHEILTSYKNDFVYGFRTNQNIIKNTYCVLVCALIDMCCINLASITEYTDRMPGQPLQTVNIRYNRDQTKFSRCIDKICKLFDDGSWRKLNQELRRNNTKSFIGVDEAGMAGLIVLLAAMPIAITAILYSIRGLIMFYYSTAFSINEKCKSMSEYIETASQNETDPQALYKQNKCRRKLDNISAFIQTRIIKETETGIQKMDEADREIEVSTYVSPQIKNEIVFE